MKVKILSGWSNPGGSTEHHINLTNLLNDNGYDCTFYGPHEWHLDKCKSGKIQECVIDPSDTIISHYLKIPSEFKVAKHILSCHETNMFPLKQMDLTGYDIIHYVSDWQRKWHDVDYNYSIIPAIIEKISWTDPNNNVAGVVGSMDTHKQTHLSIDRALADGYEKVKVFGNVTDPGYFEREVKPYVDSGKAELMGFVSKEEMYNQISKVYSSSMRECLPLIQGECLYAGIPFAGLDCNMRSDSDYEFDNQEILNRWKLILD